MRMRFRVRPGRRSVWFWLFLAVLIILLLGLIFGGYRKGTRIDSGFPMVHSGALTEGVVRA